MGLAKKRNRKRKSEPRIIKLADVFERQLITDNEAADYVGTTKGQYKRDKFYFDTLDEILDEIFEVAYERNLSWGQIAKAAGLGYATVVNLGERWTKRPQLRTVMLIADALDMALFAEPIERERPSIALRVAM
jgi:hypothetical protein